MKAYNGTIYTVFDIYDNAILDTNSMEYALGYFNEIASSGSPDCFHTDSNYCLVCNPIGWVANVR